MKKKLCGEEMALRYATYIVAYNSTIRGAAKYFGVSKSTVYSAIEKNIPKYCNIYKQLREIFDRNMSEKHIRGGMMTKLRKRNNYK